MIQTQMDPNDWFEALFSLFPPLTPEEIRKIRNNTKIYAVAKGHSIYKTGDTPQGFISLLSGSAKVFQGGVTPRDQIVRMVTKGGVIGYRALFAGENYTSFAQALSDSTVAIIARETFFDVLASNGALGLQLLRSIAIELGLSNRRTVALTQKHIRGRLADSLLFLVQTYGFSDDHQTINIRLSREELAELSSMTTANAIRTLSAFSSDEIIALNLKKIKILDYDRLVKISQLG